MSSKKYLIQRGKKKTRKNRRTKKYKNPKYFKKGGMPGKTGKKVTFGQVEEREFITQPTKITREDVELEYSKKCPPIKDIRPYHFPCRYKNTVFSNREEFLEWYKSEMERQYKPGKISKSQYKDYIKRRALDETGYWDTYIPEEFRSYDERTGVVEDIRPFATEDEEVSKAKAILNEKRRQRKEQQEMWKRDVKEFRDDNL